MRSTVLRSRLRVLVLPALGALALSGCGGGGDTASAPTTSATASTSASPDAGAAPGAATGTPNAPATAAGSGPAAADMSCGVSTFRTDVLQLINQLRAAGAVCGGTPYPPAGAVTWDDRLTNAAYAHSADMSTRNYFSHTSLDGRTYDQRVSAAGYAWSTVGENIAAGYDNAAAVIQGWMASPGHCSNVMSANFTQVGMACARNTSSTYGRYFTLDLARPR